MGPGLVGEPRCGSQCRTFVRRLHTQVLAKHRRMLRSPYVVVLAYLLMEQSLTSLNGTPPSELHVTVSRHAAQAFTNAPRGTRPLWQRPSRYAPGADGPSTRPSGWAHDREPHQRAFLPPSYLLVSLGRLAEVLS